MSTYIPISTQTLSSATSTVTLSGIPQNYTDLVVVLVLGNSDNANRDVRWTYNGDSSSLYSQTTLYGNGSVAASGRDSNATFLRVNGSTSNSPVVSNTIQIQNYSSSTTNKVALAKSAASAWVASSSVHIWRSTTPITSITFTNENGANFVIGSTFTIYGVGAGTTKAIGGDVVISGGYAYHTFKGSAAFTPQQDLTADILVIAGGGGGSYNKAGGGGAGKVVYASSQSLIQDTVYSVVVGAGGRNGTGNGSDGAVANLPGNGTNSIFGSLILADGGGRGGDENNKGGIGGSGGAGGRFGAAGTATTYTETGTAYGNNGGAGQGNSSPYRGGGGGGASSAGTSGGGGGNGGSAIGTWSTWASATGTGVGGNYAGGGGGGSYNGTAGSGGGGGAGAGQNNAPGISATANTGSGGGGGGNVANGGNGASGLVIVRYLI